MKPVLQRRRADYVKPQFGDVRIAKIWSVVEASTHVANERRWRRISVGLVAATLAVALFVVFAMRTRSHSQAPSGMAGLVIDSAGAGQTVILPDGSTLELKPATRLRIVEASEREVRLLLERGALICDVSHREKRRFIVQVDHDEVEVRGTRFEVDFRPAIEGVSALVRVRVERGAVEVRNGEGGTAALLHPGQTWASRTEAPALSLPPVASEVPSVIPKATAPSSSTPLAESARVLFERADAARLAGRNVDAAVDLDRLVRRFPSDPRAALAAYQLGRIRLHSLHQPARALDAFSFAAERDGPFREEAELGRVESADQLDDIAACKKWRDQFLARHPTSEYVARVSRLWGGA